MPAGANPQREGGLEGLWIGGLCKECKTQNLLYEKKRKFEGRNCFSEKTRKGKV